MTAAGARFLHHADNIISSVNEALRVPLEHAARPEGEVRVGLTYTVAGYFVAPLVLRFQRLFPSIAVQMVEGDRITIERELLRRKLDFGIILTSNLANAVGFEHETLFRSKRRLWLPADHHLLQAEHVSLKEVAEEPYIALTVDEAYQTALRYWHKTPYTPRVVFQTSSVEAVRTMVAGGMGVTILSDMVYRPWSLDGQRIETRDLAGIPSMDVGVAWKKGSQQVPAAKAFLEYLIRNSQYPLQTPEHRVRGRPGR